MSMSERSGARRSLAALLGTLALLGVAGSAGADGLPRPRPVTYVCQGGVRVQVTPMGDTAIVSFAGRTTTLSLMPGGSFRNDRVTWATQGGTSSLRDNATGRVQLSGCRPLR
ncbi:hypothetical protein HNQ07_003300 [Deinococcus metalli]|uniref:C-type lysozyme inhibitor domain-containing protein n=1 Tax=Deinococcus metalli TaxID=1141878 RepID=A0A7W8KGR0_9DEIO|nr:hypothetical protein [Deinococcus metalli]MBB5377800.1 hypothetical protein [Deinococcus metalli]GHF55842.1 hypothetical protein GCM10017781_35330 [Deinococcus metalli]